MVKNNNNKEIKNKKSNNNWDWDAEVIHGNAALGEQVHVKRKVRSDGPITREMRENHWKEMDHEAEQIRNNYSGQAIESSLDDGGNKIIRLIPESQLIFLTDARVPVYDENGNKIIGQENIRGEIAKRRAEWAQWEKEGKIQNVGHEIHTTDDGKVVSIKFRAAPKRLHPNEINDTTTLLVEEANKRFKIGQLGNKNEVLPIGNEGSVPMDVDQQPETSTSKSLRSSLTETSFELLLSDDKVEKASKDELVDLVNRIKEELKIREKIEANEAYLSSSQVSTQTLKEKLQKSEQLLNGFQTSSPNVDNKKNDNSGKSGIIVAIVGVSALVIGGSIAFVKSKFSKNKKK